MKTKKILLGCFIIIAVMLLNIRITHTGIVRLNAKVGSLKQAEAIYAPKDPVEAFNTWYVPGSGDPVTVYFGQMSCYLRTGWFDSPVTCTNY